MEEKTMNKEQVLDVTIELLANISVPVKYKRQITNDLEGAIENLFIVKEMLKKEQEMKDNPETATEEEPANEPEPIRVLETEERQDPE